MYELTKKFGKVLTSKSVGTGPSSYEKRIYRAAVSRKLRNTALGHTWPVTWSLYLFHFVKYWKCRRLIYWCKSWGTKLSISGWSVLRLWSFGTWRRMDVYQPTRRHVAGVCRVCWILSDACHSVTSIVTPRDRRRETTMSLLRFVLHDISLLDFGVVVPRVTSPE